MPSAFRIIGFARREKTDESWRSELRAALDQFSRTKPVDEKVWKEFSANLFYCQGDLTDAAAYQKLEEQLTSFGSGPLRENLLFYLAISPSQFGEVVEQVHRAGLLNKERFRLATHRRRETVRPRPCLRARAEPGTDPLRPRTAGLPH